MEEDKRKTTVEKKKVAKKKGVNRKEKETGKRLTQNTSAHE